MKRVKEKNEKSERERVEQIKSTLDVSRIDQDQGGRELMNQKNKFISVDNHVLIYYFYGRRFETVKYITTWAVMKKHVFRDFLEYLKRALQNFKVFSNKCFIE